MHKERECEEVVKLDDRNYLFAATNGFLKKLAFKGRDPALIYKDLTSGLLPPDHITNILSCSLEKVDGEDIKSGHDKIIDEFIEKAGLQDSAFVCRVLLSHAMIGSVKKKNIRMTEKAEEMALKSKNFLSRNFVKHGLLWAAISAILTGLVCMIFSA